MKILDEQLRSLRRAILRPFKQLGSKLKAKAQRFILKTVASHNLVQTTAFEPARSDPVASSTPNVHASYPMTDALLLAFLRSGQRVRGSNGQPRVMQAIPVGSERILAQHPLVGSVYCLARDYRVAAAMATGNYEVGITAGLERSVHPGERIIHVGPSEGYHTLSVARLLESAGHVTAVELVSSRSEVLRDNLAINGLDSRAQVLTSKNDFREFVHALEVQSQAIDLLVISSWTTLVAIWDCGMRDLVQRKGRIGKVLITSTSTDRELDQRSDESLQSVAKQLLQSDVECLSFDEQGRTCAPLMPHGLRVYNNIHRNDRFASQAGSQKAA